MVICRYYLKYRLTSPKSISTIPIPLPIWVSKFYIKPLIIDQSELKTDLSLLKMLFIQTRRNRRHVSWTKWGTHAEEPSIVFWIYQFLSFQKSKHFCGPARSLVKYNKHSLGEEPNEQNNWGFSCIARLNNLVWTIYISYLIYM